MAEKEYIERDALIESLQKIESELAYAEGKEGYLFAYGTLTGVRKSIIYTKSVPAADVVEVVRCKDCKSFVPYDGEEHKGDCTELVGLESCVYKDDFCSYGERKK